MDFMQGWMSCMIKGNSSSDSPARLYQAISIEKFLCTIRSGEMRT